MRGINFHIEGIVMRPTCLVLLGLVIAWLQPAQAETLTEKAERSGTLSVPESDPAMNSAFAKARQTLPGFIAALDEKAAGVEMFTVKVPITDKDQTEYFWISDVRHNGDTFSGTISNEPEMVQNVVNGQAISFDKSKIADWGYYENGELKGNFTTCVLLSQQDPQEAKDLEERIHLTCP
jgi:uncharacterized protein YegJ (DUF2314 family)